MHFVQSDDTCDGGGGEWDTANGRLAGGLLLIRRSRRGEEGGGHLPLEEPPK